MSQKNVEIVKTAIEAINREDWDAAFQGAAPGFELDFSRALGPYRGVYRLDQIQPNRAGQRRCSLDRRQRRR
jgi:hypothetical protein